MTAAECLEIRRVTAYSILAILAYLVGGMPCGFFKVKMKADGSEVQPPVTFLETRV